VRVSAGSCHAPRLIPAISFVSSTAPNFASHVLTRPFPAQETSYPRPLSNSAHGPSDFPPVPIHFSSVIQVGATTQYVLSTSGRPSSLRRYRALLQNILHLDVCYIPISSEQDHIDPQRFVWAVRGMNCLGGAISKDIKVSVIPFLDELDPLARSIGAVNTVCKVGDQLVGYNTDALGFEAAIKTGVGESKLTSAVIYGYGGVVSVVVAVLKRMGVRCFLTGRRRNAARQRASQLGVELFEAHGLGAAADLFVNAAPVTDATLENASNFLEALEGCRFAFDHEMPGACLSEYCRQHGIHHIPGKLMYYPQMVHQWSLFLEPVIGPKRPEELRRLIELAEAQAEAKSGPALPFHF